MRWRPDTCHCVIVQAHDLAVEGSIALDHVESKCPAHAALTDEEIWEAVWAWPKGENRRKNLVRNQLVEQHGVEPSWRFVGTGKDRVLEVHVEGLSRTDQTRALTDAAAVGITTGVRMLDTLDLP